uniref:Uncharacterized protein n=1 Tax=Trypanosoma congolense (strain IL3000) TaxID=1068625 RepID=G0UYA1_TRYCI|nr:conserved hypothetical protein [Trypanosoma congolense IL3000]
MKGCGESHDGSSPLAFILAAAQRHLGIQLCKALSKEAAETGELFLDVAKRGRSPPSGSGSKAHVTDDIVERQDELDSHLAIYRSVRSAIAASCALGHRSCHMLWGPRGCGGHRLLRLISQDCRHRPDTFVLYLDGEILKNDGDAIRCVAQQMLEFLKSPRSANLRSLDSSIRTGSFEFGNIFNFRNLMELREDDTMGADAGDCRAATFTKKGYGGRKGLRKAVNTKERSKRGRSPSPVCYDLISSGEESNDGHDALRVTCTTAHAKSGASSALPALQRSLLLMRGYGTNLVVCIRCVERFGVWCDHLLYVLSGLMHESDGQGGGMSLVMTSSAPDVRQLEKRLSSRLTCEARCIPLLPWSVSRIARACLLHVQKKLQEEVKLLEACSEKTKGRKLPDKKPLDLKGCSILSSCVGWHSSVCDDLQTVNKEDAGNVVGIPSPQAVRLLGRILSQMLSATIAELNSPPRSKQKCVTEVCFAHRVTLLSKQFQSLGATASRVTAAVSRIFGGICSGRLPLLGAAGRSKMISWCKKQCSSSEDVVSLSDMSRDTAPKALKSLWLEADINKPQSTTIELESQQHDFLLFDDMLSDCKLVKLGYCTREMLLILVYVYLRHEGGVARTVVDLLEDVASSLGTKAATALDRGAFTDAVALLHRWRILRVGGREGVSVVFLRGSAVRLREFLQEVVSNAEYYSRILGLEPKEVTWIRSLL